MSEPSPFVDIHCHLIPGIDDGAKTYAESLAMARMAAADGIGVVIATPHQLGNYSHNQAATILTRARELQDFLDQHRVPITVLPGADVRVEADLPARIERGEVLTLADRRRHVLLELPHDIYVPIDRLVAELRTRGFTGVLSHPERNAGILVQPAVLRPLVAAGCLIQITAGSLLGAFGPGCRTFSEWLIAQRLVHFVGTDAHGTKSRPPLLRKAFERIVKLAGQKTALDLCCRNPAIVAAGGHVAGQIMPKTKGWRDWLGRSKAA